MSQSSQGFPTTLVSSGAHDASITYDLPVRSAQAILKPHLIPYLFLDIERGISAEWWILLVGSTLAVYVLLINLQIRPTLSIPLALLVGFNPGMHWWTVNASFVVTLYGCFATASILGALRARRRLSRIVLATIGGWLFTCSVVGLYPPFQIPVLGALALILVVFALKSCSVVGRMEALSAIVISSTVFGILLGWFALSHRVGIQAMASTVYPGARRVNSGGLDVVGLLGAPFDLHSSAIVAGSVNYTNQSENASTFLFVIPVVLLMLLGLVPRFRSTASQLQTVMAGWFILLLLWMLVPLPGFVGSWTLLDRVPPERIKPVIVVVSVILLALHMQFHNSSVPARARFGAILVFFFLTVWVGTQYLVNDTALSAASIWRSALVWCLPLGAALIKFPRAGLWMIALVSIFTAQRINPLYTSLSPITDNPVVSAMEMVDPDLDGTWLTFSGPAQLRGVMVSTGVRTYSAPSPYPDKEFWRRFDPSGAFESTWNRYGHVRMVVGDGPTKISNPQSDVIEVTVTPCGASSTIEPGTFMIEADATTLPCAVQLGNFNYLGTSWYVLSKID
jgi:hypothetical protein